MKTRKPQKILDGKWMDRWDGGTIGWGIPIGDSVLVQLTV